MEFGRDRLRYSASGNYKSNRLDVIPNDFKAREMGEN